MTFKSHKKPRTTVLLALTATAALNAVGFAADDDDAAVRIARRDKITERIQQPPTLRVNPVAQPPVADIEEQVSRLKIDIEPPTRQQLFQLQTAGTIIDVKQAEISKDSRGEVLPLPGPTDRFNVPNTDRLGRLWLEATIIDRGFGKSIPGSLGVVNQMGRYPTKDGVKPAPTGAVMNEYLSSEDMSVSLDIDLGAPTNEFGVIVRAKSAEVEAPRGARDNAVFDFHSTGEFYGVTATADKVQLRRAEKGKITLIKDQVVAPKTKFHLTVRALGKTFQVYRDGELVLTAEDDAFTGHYAGVIGVNANAGPVTFDNYEARSYAGEFLPRMWAASTTLYRGPNVHYNTLYFEQRALERHGHHFGNLFQPFIAHGLFFVDAALLPASLGRSSPWECYASELYARPGDLVPFYTSVPQFTVKSLIYEGAFLSAIFLMAP
jgi:hypothetical protein